MPAKKTTQEIVQKMISDKQNVAHRRPDKDIDVEPGDNTKFLNHSLEVAALPGVPFEDPEAVNKRIAEYFSICQKNDMKPSIAGLALAFGYNRTVIIDIINGRTRKNLPACVIDSLKKAYALINSQMEDYMQNGKINPVAGIFLMKNNMGYKDQTDVVVSADNQDAPDKDALIKEAAALPGADVLSLPEVEKE